MKLLKKLAIGGLALLAGIGAYGFHYVNTPKRYLEQAKKALFFERYDEAELAAKGGLWYLNRDLLRRNGVSFGLEYVLLEVYDSTHNTDKLLERLFVHEVPRIELAVLCTDSRKEMSLGYQPFESNYFCETRKKRKAEGKDTDEIDKRDRDYEDLYINWQISSRRFIIERIASENAAKSFEEKDWKKASKFYEIAAKFSADDGSYFERLRNSIAAAMNGKLGRAKFHAREYLLNARDLNESEEGKEVFNKKATHLEEVRICEKELEARPEDFFNSW